MVFKALKRRFRKNKEEENVKLSTFQVFGQALPKRGLLALLGGMLILIPNSVDFSFGNLNTYVISYLRIKNPEVTYADWIYVAQSKSILGAFSAPIMGEFARRVGLRWSILFGGSLLGFGYMLTALTLDVSLPMVVLTMGMMHGISYGTVYASAIGGVLKWFPGQQGRYGSIVVAAYGFGSVIWNPLETAFVNPDNIDPLDQEGEDVYFDDPDVLDRVPGLFLLLGGIFLIMGWLGTILIRDPTEPETVFLYSLIPAKDDDEEDQDEKLAKIYNVKPKNMLRTYELYLLWCIYFTLSCTFNFINNYQKAYGQIYIKDDKFFANVAILQNIINGCSRLIGGVLYDWKGFQFVVFIASSVAAMVCYSFIDLQLADTEAGAKTFYAFAVCLLYLAIPMNYSAFPPCTNRTFGHKYFSTAYGMIISSGIVYSSLLILMTQVLFEYFGYTGLFFIAGIIGTCGMVASFIFPRGRTSEHFRARFEGTDNARSQSVHVCPKVTLGQIWALR